MAAFAWSALIALPCQPSLFATSATPDPLIVLAIRHVGAVQFGGGPAEGADARGVNPRVPAPFRLAALTEPVHVEDRCQVVEFVVRRLVEALPDGAFRDFAIPEHNPDAVRQPVEQLA